MAAQGSRSDSGHAQAISHTLMAWFDDNARDLPWREVDRDPWGVLVSEVMLQQTPVSRVEPIWREWMQLWPTPAAMAAASPADVLTKWDRLGYPRRALWLRECATVITNEHAGAVPSTYNELIALPGIGDYTASAVLAFAFKQRAIVLDTNVRRVISRIEFGHALPRTSAPTAVERAAADALWPTADTQAAHAAIAFMEFGSLICQARTPQCERCPVSQDCAWLTAGKPAPDKQPKKQAKFEGSDRQVRGRVLALLRANATASTEQLLAHAEVDEARLSLVVQGLIADGLLEQPSPSIYSLPR